MIDLNSISELKCYCKTHIVFILQFSSHTVSEEQMGRSVIDLNAQTRKRLPSLAPGNEFREINAGEFPEVMATAGGCGDYWKLR